MKNQALCTLLGLLCCTSVRNNLLPAACPYLNIFTQLGHQMFYDLDISTFVSRTSLAIVRPQAAHIHPLQRFPLSCHISCFWNIEVIQITHFISFFAALIPHVVSGYRSTVISNRLFWPQKWCQTGFELFFGVIIDKTHQVKVFHVTCSPSIKLHHTNIHNCVFLESFL